MKVFSNDQEFNQRYALPGKPGTGWVLSFDPKNKGNAGKRKMSRIFLIGALCGVMITAVVTFLFAIPANSDHWRWEIWNRGGAAWTFDRNGKITWMWTVKPVPDAPRKKRVIVPSGERNLPLERL